MGVGSAVRAALTKTLKPSALRTCMRKALISLTILLMAMTMTMEKKGK